MAKRPARGAADHALDPTVRGVSFSLDEVDVGDGTRLELRALHRPAFGAIAADWTGADLKRRIAGGRRQPLARAVGLHKWTADAPPLRVLDATAGLGRDGFTLAALGAVVTMSERDTTLCALLHDARRRALESSVTMAAASRVDIVGADARAVLAQTLSGDASWDVVYLDPMYPDDGKTALPGKEMQLIRDLTGGDDDADDLLAPALAAARVRVVVKRPTKAPWLAGVEPALSIGSTLLRFDVYLKAAIRAVPAAHDFHIP